MDGLVSTNTHTYTQSLRDGIFYIPPYIHLKNHAVFVFIFGSIYLIRSFCVRLFSV